MPLRSLFPALTSSYLSTHWVLLPMEYDPPPVLHPVGDTGCTPPVLAKPDAMKAAVARAEKAGIPVITVNS
ncbi:hypothetical protein ABZT43_30130, partial [Streptomyces sp. NPDC005349]|uniref:hypothetical protein n=1 Tax=Streptomyces sp. NPDC005349 TaxID=3157037 RepID=UPI0033A9ECFB